MDHRKVEKQAIILHPCHFARQGIRHLLPPGYRVFDTGKLKILTRWLLTKGAVDLVVINLQGQFYAMLSVLNLIGLHYPDCHILVMLDSRTYPKQKKYLARYESQVTVIEPGLSLPVFVQHLTPMMHQTGATPQKGKNSLSGQGITILGALLMGKKARQVASQLSIPEKAVSD
ncbi:response regulator transcription factor [Serratia fonticola]|uniref:response regulator transcription factor n=1 Tax=Serratia fonticola TaxID=47917 RepID=UPI00192CEF4B|nr:response regulator transcription factor [Serratia fonticola]MBL5829223.1 response regulator transcription factor [Serratia fonticola]